MVAAIRITTSSLSLSGELKYHADWRGDILRVSSEPSNNRIRQLHHLAAVKGHIPIMNNDTVATDIAIAVFLKMNVYAEFGFENIEQIRKMPLFFLR